jgi:hypothetical protein
VKRGKDFKKNEKRLVPKKVKDSRTQITELKGKKKKISTHK